MAAAALTSGISEKVQIKLETAYGDGGAGAAQTFGFIKKLSWNADGHISANYSTEGTPNPNTLTPGVLDFTATLQTDLTDGREMNCIFGTAGGSSPNFTLAVANALPSYGFYAVEEATASTNVQGKGFMCSRATLKAARKGKVTVDYDFVGQNITETATAVTVSTPATNPFVDLDISMTINAGVVVNCEDITLVIDRGTITRRGLESVGAGTKRLITGCVPKILSVTGSGLAIADKLIYRALMGGATITDTLTPANIVITITNATNSIAFTTSALLSVVGKDVAKDDDFMLMKFDFVGKTITAAGTFTP